VLLVVSHTAATAIVALLRFLPLDDRNLIMHTLELMVHQELAAQGRNVRPPSAAAAARGLTMRW
jgi:hypothetical protein